MTSTMPSLGQALRWLAATKRGERPVGDHPSFEKIVAYHAGQLSLGEEALIRDHLVACPLCPALVLELDALGGGPPLQQVGADEESGQESGSLPAPSLVPTRATAEWASWRGQRTPVVAGLALFVGSLLVAALSASAFQGRQPATRPANIEVTTLLGLRGDEPQQVTVRGERFVLAFPELMPSAARLLEIDVLDQAGRSVWRGRSTRGGPQQPVAIELSRSFPVTGSYSFVILEVEGGKTGRQLGRFEVTLSYG
jgi:hypothetical protein